jgi:hypothetical protein
MADAPKRIFLGALDVSQDEALAIAIPADLDPEALKAAIEKANAERHAAAKRETEYLRRLTDVERADGHE